MTGFLEHLLATDIHRTTYIAKEDVGKEILLVAEDRRYLVKIPPGMNDRITLRLRGLGKKRFWRSGDLFLHVWVNQGKDSHRTVWISDAAARDGTEIVLQLEHEKVLVRIPPSAKPGLWIRLRGLGEKPAVDESDPPNVIRRGNLYLRVAVYPERIRPVCGSFEQLSTDAMAMEGWIYTHFDEIDRKLAHPFPWRNSLPVGRVVDEFHQSGWKGIFDALVDHLGVNNCPIEIKPTGTIAEAGKCETTMTRQEGRAAGFRHRIFINEKFIANPFTVAAILSHELCHVIYAEKIGEPTGFGGRDTKDIERSVDLLVFLYNLGEYQLRVARESGMRLGYFNQENFERIAVILRNKGIFYS